MLTQGAQTQTLTRTKTAVKIALIAGGIMLAAAAVGGTTRLKEIFYSGGLSIYSDYYPAAGAILQSGAGQQDLFGFSMYADKESVDVKSIKFYFVPQSGADGLQMAKIFKDIKLYQKVRSSGYGYGYQYYDSYVLKQVSNVVTQLKVDSKRPNLAFAVVTFIGTKGSIGIDANGYASNSFVLKGDVSADNSWTGNFSVQIDEGTDVAATGASSGRSVSVNVNQAKGSWLKVQGKLPMTVSAPKGGEKIEIGQILEIKWDPRIYRSTESFGRVQLVLRKTGMAGCDAVSGYGCQEGVIADDATNNGFYRWSVPFGFKGVKLPADNLYVLVYPKGDLYNNFSTGRSGAPFSVLLANPTLLGDVNINGKVDIGDSMFIAQYIAVPSKRQLSPAALANADVDGDGAITNADANTISQYLAGKIKSFPASGQQSSAGSYIVSLDPVAPSSRLAVAGTTGNVMTVLRFRATGEPINITKIQLGLTNPNSSANDLAQVYLYDGSVLLGRGILGFGNAKGGTNNAMSTFVLETPLQIQPNAAKVVTIKADISPITTVNTVATAGHALTIDYLSSEAVGVASATKITDAKKTAINSSAYIYRSVPTVSLINLPSSTLTNGTQVISRFKVTADQKGDVDLRSLVFKVNASNATVANPVLVDITSGEAILIAATSTIKNSTGNFNMNFTPRTISAGTSRTFELRATASGVVTGSSVGVSLMGDSKRAPLNDYSLVLGNMVWSDMSNINHPNSPDWTNGYLVPGLPSSGLTQTLSR